MPPSKPSQPSIADPTPPSKSSCLVWIHCPDDTYHVVLLEWDVGVKKLIAALGRKLGLSKEEVAAHRLFIEERGTERVLLPTEWPARIIQGRSREAGYDDGDFGRLLSGKDASFMFKLTFKKYLTLNEADITFTNFKNVHLTNRDLRSIPKAISDHTQKIISLTLGNSIIPAVTPHFLGSCTKLHQLCWSNSAIHRVPRGLRHAFAIRHLDLSSNRIEGLQDVYLGDMPLEVLLLQNNRISGIPSYFSQFGSLKTLNLSNNNLTSFPDAISSLPILDLDLSFNHISSIWFGGSLPGLQRFLVNGNGLEGLHGSTHKAIDHLDIRHNRLTPHNYSARAKIVHATHCTNALLTVDMDSQNQTIDLSHNRLQLCHCYGTCSCSFRWGNVTSLDISHGMLSSLPLFKLQGLRILRLDHNSLKEVPSGCIQESKDLEVLSCSYNALLTFPDIRANTKLRVLDLHHNSIVRLPEYIWDIPLTNLNLTSNEITAWPNKRPKSAISQLGGSLEELFLAGNLLMGDTLKSFRDLVKLRTLHLSFNEIASLPPKFTAGFRWLEDVRLTGNRLPQLPGGPQTRALDSSHAYISDAQHGQGIFEVVHQFPDEENMSAFALFQPIPSSKYEAAKSRLLAGHLRDRFVDTLTTHLKDKASGRIADAFRLTFLDLNHQLYTLFSRSDDVDALRAGVGGLVACVVDATLYIANVGRDLAVISTNGKATLLSKIHDPIDDAERARIRAAGGWISPDGLVNGEANTSRAFGLFHLFPAITPRPSIQEWDLTESDEFLIIANHQFWDSVTYQVAVDIAQSKIDDLGVATQKLLEMALGFGAEDGVCVVVVAISELYEAALPSPVTIEIGPAEAPPPKPSAISAVDPKESPPQLLVPVSDIPAPTGHAAIVFTAIRNQTSLQTTTEASRTYRTLLRQELQRCGGYEGGVVENVFFCVFQSTLAAVRWCLLVQLELTRIRWAEGDSGTQQQRTPPYVAPVSMGVHYGPVVSEPSPITHRMEYFGPTVTGAARISELAAQGQIMCSANITRAVQAVVFEIDKTSPEPTTEPDENAAAIRDIGVVITPAGEHRLAGLGVPETLSSISPVSLAG